MGVVWVHWLMARGQIVKDSLFLMYTPYSRGHTFRGLYRVHRFVVSGRVRGPSVGVHIPGPGSGVHVGSV